MISNASCFGSANGGITASAVGGTSPYTYSWNNTATTASITGIIAATYTVIITDDNGCTSTNNGTITEPTDINTTISIVSSPTCTSTLDGTLEALATGGTGTLSYSWSNSVNTSTNANIAAGKYTVTTMDANGCLDTISATLIANDAINQLLFLKT